MDTRLPTSLSARRVPSIVLKAAMAVTGALLALWLTLHVVGNLTVFAGAALMNGYAEKLRATGLLWPVRAGLSVALLVHVLCALATSRRAYRARPQRYAVRGRKRAATWSSLSMRFTGGLLLGYLVWHVAQIYGLGLSDYVAGDVHHNLLLVLRQPLNAGLYCAATWWVTLHLAHGLGSALITLGVVAGKRERLVKRVLASWAWLVAAGFALESAAPLLGWV